MVLKAILENVILECFAQAQLRISTPPLIMANQAVSSPDPIMHFPRPLTCLVCSLNPKRTPAHSPAWCAPRWQHCLKRGKTLPGLECVGRRGSERGSRCAGKSGEGSGIRRSATSGGERLCQRWLSSMSSCCGGLRPAVEVPLVSGLEMCPVICRGDRGDMIRTCSH